jgi:predicted ATPase with chaperone activity
VAVFGINTLAEAVGLLNGALDMEPVSAGIEEIYSKLNIYDVDFSDVRGQESAKRALVVASTGSHNLLMMWIKTRDRKGVALQLFTTKVVGVSPPRLCFDL